MMSEALQVKLERYEHAILFHSLSILAFKRNRRESAKMFHVVILPAIRSRLVAAANQRHFLPDDVALHEIDIDAHVSSRRLDDVPRFTSDGDDTVLPVVIVVGIAQRYFQRLSAPTQTFHRDSFRTPHHRTRCCKQYDNHGSDSRPWEDAP